MHDPLSTISTRQTPQSRQADPRQVRNSAGAFTFHLDSLAQLRRFLVLGVDGGTYYATAPELALDNAQVVVELARSRGLELVNEVVAVSQAGRAPRQQPALFALAIAGGLGDAETRRAALDALPLVARTGTHRLTFVRYAEQFRGWGRVLKRGVADLYLTPPVGDVAYQVVKYRQRDGWTHRDLLRLAHPKVDDSHADAAERRALFDWICGRWTEANVPTFDSLRVVEGYQRAFVERNPRTLATYVREYGLTWEMLPTEALNERVVWEALLERGVPQTALMRQLPRLTRLGLLPAVGDWTARVCAQLTDAERLTKARVHPLNVLVAHKTYEQGHGERGSSTWTPSRPVVDALDAAFYAAFGAVRPTGKRLRLALDVSGSMSTRISNLPISCSEASAALALVTANVEREYEVVGFSDGRGRTGFIELSVSPRQRLADVVSAVSGLTYGGTDCALPITRALDSRQEFDLFSVYTDNETWAGNVHPHQALTRYREQVNPTARSVVVGMTSTGFTIADPTDPGMLDVVGFDTATPNLLSDFARGDV